MQQVLFAESAKRHSTYVTCNGGTNKIAQFKLPKRHPLRELNLLDECKGSIGRLSDVCRFLAKLAL